MVWVPWTSPRSENIFLLLEMRFLGPKRDQNGTLIHIHGIRNIRCFFFLSFYCRTDWCFDVNDTGTSHKCFAYQCYDVVSIVCNFVRTSTRPSYWSYWLQTNAIKTHFQKEKNVFTSRGCSWHPYHLFYPKNGLLLKMSRYLSIFTGLVVSSFIFVWLK